MCVIKLTAGFQSGGCCSERVGRGHHSPQPGPPPQHCGRQQRRRRHPPPDHPSCLPRPHGPAAAGAGVCGDAERCAAHHAVAVPEPGHPRVPAASDGVAGHQLLQGRGAVIG